MDGDVFQLPVSFAQRWMWLLDQFDPEGPEYLVPWRVPISGPLDRAALVAAWDTVIERHEALRTSFRSVDGQPVQIVAPARVPMEVVDLTAEPDPAGAANSRADELIRTPFRLDAGPPLRAALLCTGPEQAELIIVTHHIMADGWSSGLLFGDLTSAYRAHRTGTEPEFAELPIQYGDFALWQTERWEAGGFAADEDYWRQSLDGAPTTIPLPTDFTRPARQEFGGATVEFTVPRRRRRRPARRRPRG